MAPEDFSIDERLMTEKEFAAFMRQSLFTVQAWRRKGDVPPHFTNHRKVVLYRVADVTKRWAARYVQPVRRDQEF